MTPQQARAELARRELARRGSAAQPSAPQPGLIERYATPAGAVTGGVAGLFTGNPVIGSALGTTVGKYVEQKAKQQRTGKNLPFGEVLGGQAAAVGTDLALSGITAGLAKGVSKIAKGVPYTKLFKGGERFAERLGKSKAMVDLTDEAETFARAREGVNPALRKQILSKAEQTYQNLTGKTPVEDLLNARGKLPVPQAHDVGNLANQNLAQSLLEKLGLRGLNEIKQLGLKSSINRKILAADPSLMGLFKNYAMGQNINNVSSTLGEAIMSPIGIPLKLLKALKSVR